MAKDTFLNLRNQIIYCINVRNHTPEGTFNAIIPDLQRIKGLGADIIWFMPIHPIGETKRKGVEGSYDLKAADGSETVIGQYRFGNERLTGIFCLDGKAAKVAVYLPDGVYRNQLDDQDYQVSEGLLETRGVPILFKSYGEALLIEV